MVSCWAGGEVGAAGTVHGRNRVDLLVSCRCGPDPTPSQLMSFNKQQISRLLLRSHFFLFSLSSNSVLSGL